MPLSQLHKDALNAKVNELTTDVFNTLKTLLPQYSEETFYNTLDNVFSFSNIAEGKCVNDHFKSLFNLLLNPSETLYGISNADNVEAKKYFFDAIRSKIKNYKDQKIQTTQSYSNNNQGLFSSSSATSNIQPSIKKRPYRDYNDKGKISDNLYLFRLIIAGAERTGKSSLIDRYASDNFTEFYEPSTFVDTEYKFIESSNTNSFMDIKLHLIDTPDIPNSYYSSRFTRQATGFLVLFDLTNRDSFNAVDRITQNIKDTLVEFEAHSILVGTHSDKSNSIVISPEEVEQKRVKLGFNKIMMISSKTSTNVDEVFKEITSLMMRKINPNFSFRLNVAPPSPPEKSCSIL